jgi:hypothetical protein
MKRNIMISGNDKIDLKNKLNVSECRIFEYRESKSINSLLSQNTTTKSLKLS